MARNKKYRHYLHDNTPQLRPLGEQSGDRSRPGVTPPSPAQVQPDVRPTAPQVQPAVRPTVPQVTLENLASVGAMQGPGTPAGRAQFETEQSPAVQRVRQDAQNAQTIQQSVPSDADFINQDTEGMVARAAFLGEARRDPDAVRLAETTTLSLPEAKQRIDQIRAARQQINATMLANPQHFVQMGRISPQQATQIDAQALSGSGQPQGVSPQIAQAALADAKSRGVRRVLQPSGELEDRPARAAVAAPGTPSAESAEYVRKRNVRLEDIASTLARPDFRRTVEKRKRQQEESRRFDESQKTQRQSDQAKVAAVAIGALTGGRTAGQQQYTGDALKALNGMASTLRTRIASMQSGGVNDKNLAQFDNLQQQLKTIEDMMRGLVGLGGGADASAGGGQLLRSPSTGEFFVRRPDGTMVKTDQNGNPLQ